MKHQSLKQENAHKGIIAQQVLLQQLSIFALQERFAWKVHLFLLIVKQVVIAQKDHIVNKTVEVDIIVQLQQQK